MKDGTNKVITAKTSELSFKEEQMIALMLKIKGMSVNTYTVKDKNKSVRLNERQKNTGKKK